MGTKNNPGKFDCYDKAEPDEPMFVILGRDPVGQALVEIWRMLRARVINLEAYEDLIDDAFHNVSKSGKKVPLSDQKSIEAHDCALAMRDWFLQREAKKKENHET